MKLTTSNSQKIITGKYDFDSTPESEALYDFLSKHLACIAVFNVISKGKRTAAEITNLINKLEYNDKFKFAYLYKCKQCQAKIFKNLAENSFEPLKKPDCPECHTNRHIVCEEVWPLKEWDIKTILKYGVNKNIFQPSQYVQCSFCTSGFSVTRPGKEIPLNCKECNKPIEVSVDFEPIESISSELKLEDKHGYWLEWYVAKTLLKLGITPDRNIKRTIDREKVEIDVMYELAGKKVGVICDTSKDAEFDIDNFHLLPQILNSEKLVLVTTNKKIRSKIIGAAKRYFSDVIGICFSDLPALKSRLPR